MKFHITYQDILFNPLVGKIYTTEINHIIIDNKLDIGFFDVDPITLGERFSSCPDYHDKKFMLMQRMIINICELGIYNENVRFFEVLPEEDFRSYIELNPFNQVHSNREWDMYYKDNRLVSRDGNISINCTSDELPTVLKTLHNTKSNV